jgi:1-deoxy-D-xylulose-5-phosphate synthase
VRRGNRVAILCFGTLLPQAMEAAAQFDATVVDMRWVKPIDTDRVLELVRDHALLVTLEENVVAGGAGSAINEFLSEQRASIDVVNLGIPDRLIEHGDHADQLQWAGLDAASIAARIRQRLNSVPYAAFGEVI